MPPGNEDRIMHARLDLEGAADLQARVERLESSTH
jgi:hypothetical protein